MPSENDVLEIEKKRFRVLETIYDLSQQSEEMAISTYEIKNETQIKGEELYRILIFLVKKGLIKKISSLEAMYGGEATISITHDGFCEVEKAIKKPGEDTENFRAQIYNITKSNIASVTGSGEIGTAITHQYNYSPEQRQTLTESAKEIQELLEHFSKIYSPPSPTNNLKIVTETVAKIEKNPTLKSKIVNTLKVGGTEALKELLDNPAVNILMASIEGWNSAE